MNLTENYSRKMSEILGRKMSEILGWKISQKVPKVRIFPIKISSMENVRNLFVGKCHGKDDISENVRNFRSENVRNFEVGKWGRKNHIHFSLGPSAILFYYPSEGVWVIVPPFPYPPGTAHCPTLPTFWNTDSFYPSTIETMCACAYFYILEIFQLGHFIGTFSSIWLGVKSNFISFLW